MKVLVAAVAPCLGCFGTTTGEGLPTTPWEIVTLVVPPDVTWGRTWAKTGMGERGNAVESEEEEEVEEEVTAVLLLACVTALTCLTGLEIKERVTAATAAADVVAVVEGATVTVEEREAVVGLPPPVEEDGELVT